MKLFLSPILLLFALSSHLAAQSYVYDDADRLVRAIYPSGQAIIYTYDDNDNLLTTETEGVPIAPGDLVATRTSTTEVQLSWTDNSNDETGFRIERRVATSYGWAPIATVFRNQTTFVDEGVDPRENYVYRVVAIGTPPSVSAYSSENLATGEGSIALQVRSFKKRGGLFELSFESEAGVQYKLEKSNTLQLGSWSDASFRSTLASNSTTTSIRGTGSPLTIYISSDVDQNFYRLRIDP